MPAEHYSCHQKRVFWEACSEKRMVNLNSRLSLALAITTITSIAPNIADITSRPALDSVL